MSEQKKDEELLPCPFCGSTDLEVHGKPGILSAHDDVGCNDCNAFTPAPTWNRRSMPVGVPDGEQLKAKVLELIRDECKYWQGKDEARRGGFAILYAKVNELDAAPTVKAEQADEAKRIDKQCRDDVAAALGFVSGGNFAWSYLLTQIKECVRVAEAPSMPAAGSAELTAVRCQCCASEYPHDSYDAGFIAGSGMCQVCDAAMPPKDLPAAGSAVEEVEVVAWVTPEKDRAITALTEAAAREDGGAMLSSVRPYSVPCMTVAQCLHMLDHQRAALSAQQSAHVSVPRELLERVAGIRARSCLIAMDELRTLLNGGEA